MASKTISVSLAAYERLTRARAQESESFSEVILRAQWPAQPLRGSDLLEHLRRRGPVLTEVELDGIEEAKRSSASQADKWTRRSSSKRRS